MVEIIAYEHKQHRPINGHARISHIYTDSLLTIKTNLVVFKSQIIISEKRFEASLQAVTLHEKFVWYAENLWHGEKTNIITPLAKILASAIM